MTAPPATESVWSRFSDDLRRFIRCRVADDHTAEDLLQEVFLRIHRNSGALTDEERLPAWVYRITRNAIHDHFRQRRDTVPLAEADPPAEPVGSVAMPGKAGAWLEELIAQLPEPYRIAVQLSEMEGLTQVEVSERLGLSHSGAKSRVQRGRELLREALDRCCSFHFDQRGNLMDCDPKPGRTVCRHCDDLELPRS